MTAVPERIAMCADPNGLHEHVPLRPGEPMLTSCFADCRCTPVEFVRADAYQGAVEALRRAHALLDAEHGHDKATWADRERWG